MNIKRSIYIAITLFYMTMLSCVSLRPISGGEGVSAAREAFNNFLHMPAYALLTYLLIECFPPSRYRFHAAFLSAAAFGFILECLQSLVPGRFVSGLDVLLNSLGALSVFLFYTKRYPLTAKH